MLLCGGGRLLVTIALSTLIESGCPFSHRATKEDEGSIVRSLSLSLSQRILLLYIHNSAHPTVAEDCRVLQ
jgi:hypothetical protein